MVKNALSILPAIAILIFLSSTVLGANHTVLPSTTYSFTVEHEIATCDIQKDGSAIITYNILFRNYATIDYVDIGMPNKYYDLGSASAIMYADGTGPITISGISKSTAIQCGYQIPIPGMYQHASILQIFTTCKVSRMVYSDTENNSYASVEFYPTYWGSFCQGLDSLQTTIIFPASVTDPNSTKWHHEQPSWMRFEDGRIKFTWNSSGNYEHKYGVSFPKSAVTNVYEPEQPSPWENINFDFVFYLPYICCQYGPLIIVAVVLVISLYTRWRSKMEYLPPSVGVEGMGIRYGLTAPEAAVLLNVPLNKIVNMVYFGLYKKGVIAVESREPLRLRVLREDYEGLHPYEIGFRAAIDKTTGEINEEILKSATVQLIKGVDEKLRGFSRKETQEYYRKIIERAWEQVKSAQMDEIKIKALEDNFEWMYMDNNFERGIKRHYKAGLYRVPVWYGFLYPRYSAYSKVIPVTQQSPQAPSLPMLPGSDIANQIVSGIQNSANQFVRNLTGFTQSVSAVTNPLPATTGASGGRGGWGGGGCACACACAGCACACAGGGR